MSNLTDYNRQRETWLLAEKQHGIFQRLSAIAESTCTREYAKLRELADRLTVEEKAEAARQQFGESK